MSVLVRSLIVVGLCAAALALSQATPATRRASMMAQMPTEERVRAPGWWPTKGAPGREAFVGPQACAQCHASIVESQQRHAMARSSIAAAESGVLHDHAGERFGIGPHSYAIDRTPDGAFTYAVSDGTSSVSGRMTWAFGTGKVGQTYLAKEENGQVREVRFSFFRSSGRFDVTPNQSPIVANSVERAAGRIVPDVELRRCFACHSTASTTSGRFEPSRAMLGITCEACHGPGADHVAVEEAGLPAGAGTIVNPKRMSPGDQVDFCGACHTSWWDVTLSGAKGEATVHFQPYRLQNSPCWGNGDVRLTCTACHDPHEPLVQQPAFYDAKCLACHVSPGQSPDANRPGAACRTATRDCVTCHMPKQVAPDMHFAFTDHWIRIARPGEPFPE